METTLKQTPLYRNHVALKGRMVEFAGWSMPVMYSGILEETRAVRQSVGIFDISHMGRVRVSGSGATALLQEVTSNDVAALQSTEAQYSLLTNPTGGIIDDIIVYREAEESYLVVINASNTAKDLEWIRRHNSAEVSITDQTDETAMIAVQGPAAPEMVASLVGMPELLELKRFQYGVADFAGVGILCCRTGYTGEDGFELIVPAGQAGELWEDLLKNGAVACGLGARDALRIEAGYPLYGHEIDDTTTPVEAGLMWVVSLEKGDFIGKEAISSVKTTGSSRRLVGLSSRERIQPRQGYTIYRNDVEIGVVTSGVFSPTVGHSVAMGYVDRGSAKTGTEVTIAVRDKRCSAHVVPKKALLEA
jgi:aminomethyltransferase